MHPDTITIPLTQGKVAIIDVDDAERVLAHRGHTVYLHRFIVEGPNEMLVDHADNDGLNCRRSNMRLATKAQNQANSPGHKPGVSGFRGVIQAGKKWRAQMTVNNRRRHIGCYDTPEDAARAYDEAVRAHWGEFAVTNF